MAACDDPDTAVQLLEQFEQDEARSEAELVAKEKQYSADLEKSIVSLIMEHGCETSMTVLLTLMPAATQQSVWSQVAASVKWRHETADRVRRELAMVRQGLSAVGWELPPGVPVPDPKVPF